MLKLTDILLEGRILKNIHDQLESYGAHQRYYQQVRILLQSELDRIRAKNTLICHKEYRQDLMELTKGDVCAYERLLLVITSLSDAKEIAFQKLIQTFVEATVR